MRILPNKTLSIVAGIICFLTPAVLNAAMANENKTLKEPDSRPKAPFNLLYSNDFTNNMVTMSPYHERGENWNPGMLKASVEEAAEAKVHLLQPSTVWVPWWQSDIYSMKEHRKWWKQYYGVDIIKDIDSSEKYVNLYLLRGGDPLSDFVRYCREVNVKPFISFRLNDGHHKEHAFKPHNKAGTHTISKFYVEHPEYIIGKGKYQTYSRVEMLQNWAIPEVRDHKYSLIEEVCENYDIDGIELDYMRHHGYFRMGETTSEQRADIMTNFVRRVRHALDRNSKPGQHRWLCVRIPCYVAFFDTLGIDLARMYEAGVDMVNVSASYFTIQQNDMALIRKMVPDAAVYLEMCHTTRIGRKLHPGKYDSTLYRRTTPLQYYTAAHLAYSRGLDGVSLFNFVYYREHGTNIEARGPFHEPPFEILEHLDDSKWLARQPQHYIWRTNNSYKINDTGSSPMLQNSQKPPKFAEGKKVVWDMDMAPPAGGWKKDGKLRIQSDQSLNSSQWSAVVNGKKLNAADDVSEPYENPYPQLLGLPEQHRAWVVPHELLVDGNNRIEIEMTSGSTEKYIVFIDIAIQ